MKTASEELSLDFLTVSALSDEERALDAAAQLERAALLYASAAQAVHSRVYGECTAEVAALEASGPRVSGCIRTWQNFRPNPVL